MLERYIPALIVLIAAAITGIINIIHKVQPLSALKRMLLVILAFYIIGLIVRGVVKKAFMQKPKEEEIEETEENKEQEVPTEE